MRVPRRNTKNPCAVAKLRQICVDDKKIGNVKIVESRGPAAPLAGRASAGWDSGLPLGWRGIF